MKPKVDGICDKDGQQLVQREDDKPEVVANRLKTYHEQTAAVVGYYSKSGRATISINAQLPVDEVTELIFTELDKISTQGD